MFKAFMQINFPGKLHPTSDVTNIILGLSCTEQIWLSTCFEKDTLSSTLKNLSDTFHKLFLFITSK